MKAILLQDKKGFVSTVFVPAFPPVYRIAIRPDITVNMFKRDDNLIDHIESPRYKELEFFPQGEPVEVGGVTIVHYYEY